MVLTTMTIFRRNNWGPTIAGTTKGHHCDEERTLSVINHRAAFKCKNEELWKRHRDVIITVQPEHEDLFKQAVYREIRPMRSTVRGKVIVSDI